MKTLCLFFCLVGAIHCLQSPLSYKYLYSAVIDANPLKVGSDEAHGRLETVVEVDMISSYYGVVKLTKPNFNPGTREGNCGGFRFNSNRADEIPNDIIQNFSKPFKVYFNHNADPVIEVPMGEPLWITNIRKSIVEILRVIPTNERKLTRTVSDVLTHRYRDLITPLVSKAFKQREKIIHGDCMVEYSLTPASPTDRLTNPKLIRDIQETAGETLNGRYPKVSDYMYILQRSVDFTDCNSPPVFIQSSNSDTISNSTYDHHKDYIHQSSVGRYLLRGEIYRNLQNNLRLERTEITSSLMVRPLGVKDATLLIISNQTMLLQSVTHSRKRTPVPVPLDPVPTMSYEIISPFKKPMHGSPRWIRYLDLKDDLHPVFPEFYAGGYVPESEELKDRLMDTITNIDQIFNTAENQEGSTSTPKVSEYMSQITDIVRALPVGDLKDLFENDRYLFNGKYKQILAEAFIASGSPAALTVLLEKDVRKEGILGAYSFLTSLTSSANSPFIFKQMVTSMKTPLLPYILGTAKIFRRVCELPGREYFGQNKELACSSLNDLVDFIQIEIARGQSTIQKAALIYALSYLDAEKPFKIVTDIMADRKRTTAERSAAVFGLMPQHSSKSRKEEILEKLTPILESGVENPEMRQIALMTMLSWQPPLSWWQRLAKSSWNEESYKVSEFIYEATKTVSRLEGSEWNDQKQMASAVLPLLRPVVVSSHQSVLKIIQTFASPPVMESETKLGWILNMKTMLPEKLFVSLKSLISDVNIPTLEALFMGNNLQKLFKQATEIFYGEFISQNNTLNENLDNYIKGILLTLGNIKSSDDTSEGLLLVSLFSSLPFAISTPSLNRLEEIVKIIHEQNDIHKDVNFLKYINPISREIVLPSNMGIPLIARIRMPTIFYQKGKYEFVSSKTELNGSKPIMSISFSGNTICSSTIATSLNTYLPWNKHNFGSQLKVSTTLNLPRTEFGTHFNIVKGYGRPNFKLFIKSNFTDQTAVTMYSREAIVIKASINPVVNIRSTQASVHPYRYPLPSLINDFKGYIIYQETHPEKHLQNFDPLKRIYPETIKKHSSDSSSKKFITVFMESSKDHPSYASVKFGFRDGFSQSLEETPNTMSRQVNCQDFRNDLTSVYRGNHLNNSSERFFEIDTCLQADRHNYQMIKFIAASISSGSKSGDISFKTFFVPTKVVNGRNIYRDRKILVTRGDIKLPVLPSLDSIDSILSGPLSLTAEFRMIDGFFFDEKEIAKLRVNASISREQLTDLAKHVPRGCNFDSTDPSASLRRKAFYDSFDMDLVIGPSRPEYLIEQSYHLKDALQGILFPFSSNNCYKANNPEVNYTANITRSLGTRAASGWIVSPTCNAYIENVPVAEAVDLLLLMSGSEMFSIPSIPHLHPPSHQCIILPSKIITFDGATFETDDEKCERVIVMHKSRNDGFIITFGKQELNSNRVMKIVLPYLSLNVLIEESQIKINDEIVRSNNMTIENKSGHQVGYVQQTENLSEVFIFDYFKITIKDGAKIILDINKRFSESITGLCGNYDSESWGDLKDSQGCVYRPTDGLIYTASWSHLSCTKPNVRESLIHHQWSCPTTIADLALPKTKVYGPDVCDFYAHRVITVGDELCLTTIPILQCQESCMEVPGMQREAVFEVKCWPEEVAPDGVLAGKEEGHLSYFEEAYGRRQPFKLTYPLECMPTRH